MIPKPPTSIAVIGGGPAGLFYCHAMESILRHVDESSSTLFSVTCFEQSHHPGGVWKANEEGTMYDALWTNGPSHTIEFPDYTFDEHFGRPVTVYLTRAQVLGYLIGRVTAKCPDFFAKYVQFGTKVQHVAFDDKSQKFCVTTTTSSADSNHQDTRQHLFDKVVWACGDNGIPYIPNDISNVFCNFAGRFIHSSDTGNLEQDVRDKRILLIGGGYSAEDLALQAIKMGVNQVYVCSRGESASDACGLVAKAWPHNKVKVLWGQAPVSYDVASNCIQFQKVEWTMQDGYSPVEDDDDAIETELRDIDTVICCTGYKRNFSMLAKDLQLHPNKKFDLTVPLSEWSMPTNSVTKLLGDVEPGHCHYYTDSTSPELYRGVLIRNPNMMFVWTFDGYFPLLSADVSAHLLASYCTGQTPLPTSQEMVQFNKEQALNELKMPYYRYYMDPNYNEKVTAYDEEEGLEDEWEQFEDDVTNYQMRVLAEHMKVGKYPVCIGDMTKLNKLGETMLRFDDLSEQHRTAITSRVIKKQPWKTFRDYTNADQFYSLYTETRAVPLSQHWLDILNHHDESSVHEEEKKNNL